jgi:hypothetical protein
MSNQYIPFLIFLGAGLSIFLVALAWRDLRPFFEKRRERKKHERKHDTNLPTNKDTHTEDRHLVKTV